MTDSTYYERLSELIVAVEGFAQPALLHGALCGHLCAGSRWTMTQFITQALDLVENKKKPEITEKKEFQWLYEVTLLSLESETMDFSPVIPDKNESLQIQLNGLTTWISAFLSGFGSSGQDFSSLADEVKEILQDLADISQVESDDELEEDDLYTIIEHVRLSAVHLFLAYNEPKKNNQQTTH